MSTLINKTEVDIIDFVTKVIYTMEDKQLTQVFWGFICSFMIALSWAFKGGVRGDKVWDIPI